MRPRPGAPRPDWTVAAALAHLAFGDGWVEARRDRDDRDGAIRDLPAGSPDLANAAGHRIAAPPSEAAAHALATGRPAMVDRSLHRGPRLDEIERALAGERPAAPAIPAPGPPGRTVR